MEERDSDLVKRFQSGDIAAFETFIKQNQNRLHRLAGAFLVDKASQEDAVQEVFIRAYKGLPKFRFRSKPFTWLYRTLKNVCSEMNKQQTQRNKSFRYESEMCDEAIKYEQRQQLSKLFSCLSELSKRERDVVLLRVFEEFSEKETAVTLGIRNGTVKTLLHRGMKKIKSHYGEITET